MNQAIVLKNYVSGHQKVIILHKTLGKIVCEYAKNGQAVRLCTGSLLYCDIEKRKNSFQLKYFDVFFVPTHCFLVDIVFFHEMIKLCLKVVPNCGIVPELFEFLWNIFFRFDQLADSGRYLVLLRLFLMFDLLPENIVIYHCALQDPFCAVKTEEKQLAEYVKICWRRFYLEH
ncbi:hypothetical protein HYV11_01635 [Candidatus Dependentiae bacterium]|nr:hypothetical protein [Candidatus Dependentiae bacterium]